MPWTDPARRQYARPAARDATDLTDAEYALVAPHLPPRNRLGRPREVDLREVVNALLYLLRTGCPWRLLPKDFPPKSTVFGYFQRLWQDGTWPTLHALLVMAAREQAGREASPTAGIIDRQSVRTPEAGGPKGEACPPAGKPDRGDAGKRVDGRKRHIPSAGSCRPLLCRRMIRLMADHGRHAGLAAGAGGPSRQHPGS